MRRTSRQGSERRSSIANFPRVLTEDAQEPDHRPLGRVWHALDERAVAHGAARRQARRFRSIAHVHCRNRLASGGVVTESATSLADLVRSLVLAEPPVLPLLSRTSVGDAARKSWVTRVLAPAGQALDGGNVEEGLRRFFNGLCGTPCFDGFPQARRTELIEKDGPAFRSELLMDVSGDKPSLACEKLGQVKRPTLLVTGERGPAVLLMVTAELERCLEGERQVMVPDAGHGMHSDNPDFYNQAVMGFLQRR